MYSEYSVAYSYQRPEEVELFSRDFRVFLQGLFEVEKYQHALKQVPDIFFDLLQAPDLRNTPALPPKWQELLQELIDSINHNRLTYTQIDESYAQRNQKSAYEASYLQALYFLITYYHQWGKLKLNPIKYKHFIAKVLPP